jgi:cell division protein ZapE
MSRIRSKYAALVRSGEIRADAAQSAAIDELARLENSLKFYTGGWARAFGLKPRQYGLYLWGPPGRGKSMMMDLFFNQSSLRAKRRIHFHAFMQEVHHLVHVWREGSRAERQKTFGQAKGDDPIAPIAARIAKTTTLLCFDEFQVTDIADAMILGRLFDALIKARVFWVATSNRPPEDLYKDGLNRDRFVPFIAHIREKLKVVEIAGPKDFRMDRLKDARLWFCPSRDSAERQGFEALWRDMTALMTEMPAILEVNQRKLGFPRAAGPILRATFAELCTETNGPADYLAIAQRFTTVFIDGVPVLGPERRNEARRFVTLIDALYEAHAKTVVLADVEPAKLYPQGDGAFEFERTVSRLEEMRSQDYVSRGM